MPKHEWQGSKLRFQLTPKTWGKWVDLRGPAGKPGGGVFVGGGSAGGVPWDPDALGSASDATPEQFIVRQGGTWVRASYAQMQAWFPGGVGPQPTAALLTESGDTLTTESGDTIVQE